MGYQLTTDQMSRLFDRWKEAYLVYGPRRMEGEGMYSDTDVICYGQLSTFEELELENKSDYSFKEVLLPITQLLFYFTEDTVKEANAEWTRDAVVFLRSCDFHALKRLDELYMKNGYKDYYYQRLREHVKFVLIGCHESCAQGFCVSMGTNRCEDYDAAINLRDGLIGLDVRSRRLEAALHHMEADAAIPHMDVTADYVTENHVTVTIPSGLTPGIASSPLWDEYDSRCIACGRCNFVCPTCTCFTMQDIFYTDNGKAGERRRVHASCMVDGYTDVAGGSYRKKNGERMRFKVLHKMYDFNKRYGYHMCVGCGRCDDVCPEYISFSGCVNKLNTAVKEGR